MAPQPLNVLLLAGLAAGIAPSAAAGQAAAASQGGLFAPPVRVTAGDAFAGYGRMYPSPAFHDVDGDGLLDLVVGDLPGRVTWARRMPGEGLRFEAERKMTTASGDPMDFGNW